MSTKPVKVEIENLAGTLRLNGKTIKEWKEDCETFFHEKLEMEKLKDKLESEISMLENSLFEAKEVIRHIDQRKTIRQQA